jgi:hypothetical protein
MNRLIIIGNGFDLAHGLKTSYNDFMLSLVSAAFVNANTTHGHTHDDDIFTVIRHRYNHYNGHLNLLPDYCYYLTRRTEGTHSKNAFDWNIKDPLFQRVIKECNLSKWVDIENEFYQMLVAAASSGEAKRAIDFKAKKLSASMGLMKSKLKKYLKGLDHAKVLSKYTTLFYQRSIQEKESGGTDFCILDYNYTRTSMMYNSVGEYTVPIIHIHGEITHDENQLIFGFGDYLDKNYLFLEQANVNALLDNIKSNDYKLSNNYTHLKEYLEKDYFEVLLFGHSCGLSDRTTLSRIFNHRNCRLIKIFHYQNNEGKSNYLELVQEISRHFPDKELFEDRVAPFDSESRMPQWDD